MRLVVDLGESVGDDVEVDERGGLDAPLARVALLVAVVLSCVEVVAHLGDEGLDLALELGDTAGTLTAGDDLGGKSAGFDDL